MSPSEISIFNGVNNFASYSVLDDGFSQYFGFVSDEVDQMLSEAQQHQIQEEEEKLKEERRRRRASVLGQENPEEKKKLKQEKAEAKLAKSKARKQAKEAGHIGKESDVSFSADAGKKPEAGTGMHRVKELIFAALSCMICFVSV